MVLFVAALLTGSDVFLRILIKRPLAPRSAEIIGLPLVFGFSGGCLGINFHTTYGIDYCIRHTIYPFLLKFQKIDFFSEAKITKSIGTTATLTGRLLQQIFGLEIGVYHLGA